MGAHGWCLCSGSGKSERMKGSLFCSDGPAMASFCGGTGFLIHKALLLTTHTNLPSVSAAEGVEIQLHYQCTAKLMPHRFFITNSILDLTVVGFDIVESNGMTQVQHPHRLKTCSHPCLELGSMVYLLGHTNKTDLTVGDGKVVIATDNLIKVATGGVIWTPGSAGFDAQGNLAFMVCEPMKLASSPTTKSSSTTSSSSSTKKDHSTQFGIPIPIICQWLNQHWDGTLDELNKPRMPIIRLISTGQKSEPSSASFTLCRVFKPEENSSFTLSSQIYSKYVNHRRMNGSTIAVARGEGTRVCHEQGIPTPEIYDSPMLTAGPISKTENPQAQILDVNVLPKNSKAVVFPLSIRGTSTPANNAGHNNITEEVGSDNRSTIAERPLSQTEATLPASDAEADISNVNFLDDTESEVQSSSPVEVSAKQNMNRRFHDENASDAETMYSAETRESRNYSSPREEKLPQVGRSWSYVSYGRSSNGRRKSPSGHGPTMEKQQSLLTGRKLSSYRTHDYFSPTVSSIMKKRNSAEQQADKPRSAAAQLSPRWMF